MSTDHQKFKADRWWSKNHRLATSGSDYNSKMRESYIITLRKYCNDPAAHIQPITVRQDKLERMPIWNGASIRCKLPTSTGQSYKAYLRACSVTIANCF